MCQQFPQSFRTPKFILFNRDVAVLINKHRGIANLKYITVLTYTVLRVGKLSLVNIRHKVGACYSVYIFSTEPLYVLLEKLVVIIITIIIIFSDKFAFRRLVYNLFLRTYVCVGSGNRS
jgi:hypothetical protein